MANFKELVLKFEVQGREFTIKGDLALCKTVASLKSMVKCLKDVREGPLLECWKLEVGEGGEGENTFKISQDKLHVFLEVFQGLFETPKSLRPSRFFRSCYHA